MVGRIRSYKRKRGTCPPEAKKTNLKNWLEEKQEWKDLIVAVKTGKLKEKDFTKKQKKELDSLKITEYIMKKETFRLTGKQLKTKYNLIEFEVPSDLEPEILEANW